MLGIMPASVFAVDAKSDVGRRPVTASDCVQVNYVTGGDLRGPIAINSQGTRVVYEVKAANIQENRNTYSVYVKELEQDSDRENGDRIYQGENIVGLRWSTDGTRVYLLARDTDTVSLMAIDVASKQRKVVVRASTNLLDYGISRDEKTIVYVTDRPRESLISPATKSSHSFSQLISPDPQHGAAQGRGRLLFVTKLQDDGTWSKPRRVEVKDPFTRKILPYVDSLDLLSLSPDGQLATFSYGSETTPPDWRTHPRVQSSIRNGSPIMLTVVVSLDNGETSVPLHTVWAGTPAFWSNDSRSLILVAPAPVGSRWLAEDTRLHRTADSDADMFSVDLKSGEVEEVVAKVPYHHQVPLAWTSDGGLVVKTHDGTISIFHRAGTQWVNSRSVQLPFERAYPFSSAASDGDHVIGVYEATTTPPNLYSLDLNTGRAKIITDLNPQMDKLTLAPAMPVRWNTPDGLEIHGMLFKPIGYVPGRRYPLVIQTKGQQEVSSFVCDSGMNHDPAFAPQPLANAGIMYLIRTFPEDFKQEIDIAHQPKGYPGEIGQAVQQMEIWTSAVKSLSARGLIDPSKVGIIGFSRTGWHVEYTLTHSHTPFAAASVADNVQYSLGEYWLLGSRDYDNMYGGPPYGPSLDNWIKYSISFNLDKIHAPLLIERMGHGVDNNVPGQIPPGLAIVRELAFGLTRLNKPVELYYFPNVGHQPDAPLARRESLEHNVDWFRFWLQGYERPDPEDPDQYKRWEHLRELRDADQKAARLTEGSLTSKVPH